LAYSREKNPLTLYMHLSMQNFQNQALPRKLQRKAKVLPPENDEIKMVTVSRLWPELSNSARSVAVAYCMERVKDS
jgi:hypothetical protein